MSKILKYILAILSLALFDALIGGSITAIMASDGWTAMDQDIIDVYQLSFGIIVFFFLIWLRKDFFITKLVLFSLLVYTEDAVYFFMLRVTAWITKLLFGYSVNTGLPERVSGWVGWTARVFFDVGFWLDISTVLFMASSAVLISLFTINQGEKWRQ